MKSCLLQVGAMQVCSDVLPVCYMCMCLRVDMCGYVWICVDMCASVRTEHPTDLVGLSPCLYESMDHPPTYGIS